jgi:hypothetical protein
MSRSNTPLNPYNILDDEEYAKAYNEFDDNRSSAYMLFFPL